MSELFPRPAELAQVEYVQLYFHLEICDYFDLPKLGLLQLRRELLQALQQLKLTGEEDLVRQLTALLQPALPTDPGLRRTVQKPAPALILKPDISLHGLFEPKQRLVLPAFFLGEGIKGIAAFRRLLEQLGQQGLFAGSGQFRLEAIESEDNSGQRSMLWVDGEAAAGLRPPLNDLGWWLQRQAGSVERCTLEIHSPLRVLKQKKPLFSADFTELFPFILRRVTALLACHASIEPVDDPVGLIQQAAQVEVGANRVHWQDWRRLEGSDKGQDLGGLTGTLELSGPALIDLQWVLQLGSLFNVGKGAAYGAGQFRLRNH